MHTIYYTTILEDRILGFIWFFGDFMQQYC